MAAWTLVGGDKLASGGTRCGSGSDISQQWPSYQGKGTEGATYAECGLWE